MGAHPNEYHTLAPRQSYIHVDQFQSPKQLAQYLLHLDNNDEQYNKYFAWKGSGEFHDSQFMCRLCAMVEVAPSCPVWYEDINKWWTQQTCLSNNETWKW